MEENPYAAPAVYGETVPDKTPIPEFYIVAKGKFFALYLLTFGLYGVYWNFKNWSLYKLKNRAELWPIPRAIFPVFFTHALCNAVDEVNRRKNPALEWNPGGLATSIVVVMLVGSIMSGLANRNVGSPITDLIGYGTIILQAFLTFRVQRAINLASSDPEGVTNQRFTAANILWMIVGGMVSILAMIGLFLPVASN